MPCRIVLLISGGQSGADQAGIRAARAAGIPTGGWAPLGWLTEDGPAWWLAGFGLRECEEPGYPARTGRNARDSDGTIWFGSGDSSGFGCTMNACRKHGKPALVVKDGITRPTDVRGWLKENEIVTLNVAGNRESKAPGIGARVEAFLARVFSHPALDLAPPDV